MILYIKCHHDTLIDCLRLERVQRRVMCRYMNECEPLFKNDHDATCVRRSVNWRAGGKNQFNLIKIGQFK